MASPFEPQFVSIPNGAVVLEGDLTEPDHPRGIVVFAHGSGSSRHSPRNRYVAERLVSRGLSTLLFDLLTPGEESADIYSAEFRFDINLLAQRLGGALDWLAATRLRHLPVGLFGASTGAAAALVTAAEHPGRVAAVVSRGGRPDLAGDALEGVTAPVLLVVGGHDPVVIDLNEEAFARLHGEKELRIVPGATHLFEEAGALEAVAQVAGDWFVKHLHGETASRPAAPGEQRAEP